MTDEARRILRADGTWDVFEEDWRKQCESYGEDFADYASGTFSVLKEIIDEEHEKAAVFAFLSEKSHRSICQVNTKLIPGYDSPVMRVRFMTMCPDLDFGDNPIDDYIHALVHLFAGAMAISDEDPEFQARHVKVHLRSPNDRQFFSVLGAGLNEADEFESVRVAGSWLYITKS
ncbi:hypothetical protein [Oricola sp.]|uniref:hypothetical protein n=1 Tax=Oricola sp. TaxID=1979950 RepID=UPI0035158315